MRRAEPGATEATELYSPFMTPASSFIEWGVGVDLYFSTLWTMAVLLLCAGLINIPNIMFYMSSDYSPDGKSGVWFSLVSSAICKTGEWVVCSDCTMDQGLDLYDVRQAQDGTILVLRNACDGGQLTQGIINLATAIFLAIMIALVSLYTRAREVRFDEDK